MIFNSNHVQMTEEELNEIEANVHLFVKRDDLGLDIDNPFREQFADYVGPDTVLRLVTEINFLWDWIGELT